MELVVTGFQLPSPVYLAVMSCPPPTRVATVIDATPLTSLPVPINTPPSKNWTSPVGKYTEPGVDDDIWAVAVRVMAWPTVEAGALETTVKEVVDALVTYWPYTVRSEAHTSELQSRGLISYAA